MNWVQSSIFLHELLVSRINDALKLAVSDFQGLQLVIFNIKHFLKKTDDIAKSSWNQIVRRWFRLLGLSTDESSAGLQEYLDAVFLGRTISFALKSRSSHCWV